jgi:hypothetical protein
MPRRTDPEQKIATLQQRKAALDAQLARERAKLKAKSRKDDTRRKILAGALALEHAEISPEFGNTLNRLLREHLTRDDDRRLFGLDPLPRDDDSDDNTAAADWTHAVNAAE